MSISNEQRNNFGLMVAKEVCNTDPSSIKVRAPWDNAEIGSVATANAVVVEQALQDAEALASNRDTWLPTTKRIEILSAVITALQNDAEYFAVEAAREGGKPLQDSQVEVTRAIDCLKICIETLRTEAGSVIPMGVTASSAKRLAMTTHEPIGVVVAVSAFNHPLNLIAHQIGPAIAVGCPVIVKPAKATPLSCCRLVRLFHEAGLPKAWCQVVLPENNELSTKLVADARVNFFSFIGSSKVGWMLRAKLAPGARCALEHGGVAPVVVAADADVEAAIPLLAKGAMYHAGQVCVSVQRIYVEASIADEFAKQLSAAVAAMKVGDPTQAETEIGPLIDTAEVDRVEAWVNEAMAAGAECLTGGQRLSDSCYQPTLLLNPPDDSKVSQQEVFGPVVCVYSVDSIDEAITRANALDVSFQAAVWTRALDTALRCYEHLNAAAVMVNDHTAFRVDWMPFAGAKTSGHGVGGIPYTMHEMTTEKLLVMRSTALLN